MISDRLTQPVGRFMRPCVSADTFTSIQIAIQRMREAGQELIPVVDEGRVQGTLTEAGILRFVAESGDPDAAVADYMEPATKILNRATGAETLRQLEKQPCLIVVDDHDILCGLVTASCFVGAMPEKARPAMVGGMATPFGVYLTSGSVNGGRSGLYLASTGAFLILPVMIGGFISDYVGKYLPNTQLSGMLLHIVAFLPMILVFRFHPIAGYHAAEHQVVHAIERDEALTPDVVRRMPRVHPRCGTNLAVAAGIFSGIAFGPWSKGTDGEYVFIALFITLFLWRPIGSFVQYWITTKKPTDKQIESGIRAGQELLANYQIAPNRAATPLTRILNSGLLHVMAGSGAALLISELIARLFGTTIWF